MYSAIIVAAGKGERTGLDENKVLYEINRKSIIRHAIEGFKKDKDCKEIIVVYRKEDINPLKAAVGDIVDKFVIGGAIRQESVYNGLLNASEAYVLIHDGARPYVNSQELSQIKKALKHYDAVTLALPVVETVKKTMLNKIVDEVDRENLVLIQTPQAFKKDKIIEAYNKAKEVYTCDASLVKSTIDLDVYTVLGSRKNIKFTTLDDIELLELILS